MPTWSSNHVDGGESIRNWISAPPFVGRSNGTAQVRGATEPDNRQERQRLPVVPDLEVTPRPAFIPRRPKVARVSAGAAANSAYQASVSGPCAAMKRRSRTSSNRVSFPRMTRHAPLGPLRPREGEFDDVERGRARFPRPQGRLPGDPVLGGETIQDVAAEVVAGRERRDDLPQFHALAGRGQDDPAPGRVLDGQDGQPVEGFDFARLARDPDPETPGVRRGRAQHDPVPPGQRRVDRAGEEHSLDRPGLASPGGNDRAGA